MKMRKRLLTVVCFFLTFMLIGIALIPASAATVIGSISLSVEENDWNRTTNPNITVNAKGYTIGDVSWSEHVSECEPADYIYGTFTLFTDNGYAFLDNIQESSISIANGSLNSFDYTDNGNICITIMYQVRGIAEKPYDLYWDNGVAKWSCSSDKVNFELRICNDKNDANGMVVAQDISSCEYDLSAYVYGSDYITFKVRATPKPQYKGIISSSDYAESYEYFKGSLFPDISPYNPSENGWKHIGDDWYFWQDGEFLHGQYYVIDDKVFGFRNDGTMITDWYHASNGYWFFFQSNGVMLKDSWHWDGSNWYYLTPEGTMQTGWLQLDGNWYYFDLTDGSMYTGWNFVEGEERHFDSDGVLIE